MLNKNSTGRTKESLFEIQYDGNATGGWGGSGGNVWRAQAWEADIAPRRYSSQQSLSINQWVLDLFLSEQTIDGQEDPRAKFSVLWNYPGAMIYQDVFCRENARRRLEHGVGSKIP